MTQDEFDRAWEEARKRADGHGGCLGVLSGVLLVVCITYLTWVVGNEFRALQERVSALEAIRNTVENK